MARKNYIIKTQKAPRRRAAACLGRCAIAAAIIALTSFHGAIAEDGLILASRVDEAVTPERAVAPAGAPRAIDQSAVGGLAERPADGVEDPLAKELAHYVGGSVSTPPGPGPGEQVVGDAAAGFPAANADLVFGMVSPFSGANKDAGFQLKTGFEAAFGAANDAGGVAGRTLKLVTGDDGYDPTKTLDAIKSLKDKDHIFGLVGDFGTATAAAALPYVLENHMLYYAPLSGAPLLRNDPPDRYVVNYRPSYAEETDAAVKYLVKVRRLRPEQIVVFTQQDGFGDAGYAGVEKAFRSLGDNIDPPARLFYTRNTIDVAAAVDALHKRKYPPKAIVMVATYRAAAKFIEKTREQYPDMLYTNVSAVGSTALADELTLLGPKFAAGVIVTQDVPPPDGFSALSLEYRKALTKSAGAERPDYTSFEGFVEAKILIEALKRAGPGADVEKLIDAFETIRNWDVGLGTPVNLGRAEHQASHKVWGTELQADGKFAPIDLL